MAEVTLPKRRQLKVNDPRKEKPGRRMDTHIYILVCTSKHSHNQLRYRHSQKNIFIMTKLSYDHTEKNKY